MWLCWFCRWFDTNGKEDNVTVAVVGKKMANSEIASEIAMYVLKKKKKKNRIYV